jgi:hypothetical protein
MNVVGLAECLAMGSILALDREYFNSWVYIQIAIEKGISVGFLLLILLFSGRL